MSNINKTTEIIIIGAGPAGSLTAYLLAKMGFKVTVFEKNTFPITNKVCGEYLCPAGHKLLEQLSLGSLLLNYPKITGMKLYSPNFQMVNTQFPNSEFGHALKRINFDNDLITLAQSKNVTFHFGTQIQTIKFEEKCISISDGTTNWKATHIIGADGRQSIVGKWLNIAKKVTEHRVAIHTYLPVRANIKSSLKKIDQGEMHIFNDGSYCGLNPVSDEYWNFSIVCNGSKIKNYDSLEELIKETIKGSKRLTELFDSNSITEKLNIKVTGKITNPIKSLGCEMKQVALVGDAAGFVDPLTGEGIYHALFTAQILCESFAKHNNFPNTLKYYESIIKASYHKKEIINYFFQWLIKHPLLCNGVAYFLNSSLLIRTTFIGLVGNLYSPLQALKIIFTNVFKKGAS